MMAVLFRHCHYVALYVLLELPHKESVIRASAVFDRFRRLYGKRKVSSSNLLANIDHTSHLTCGIRSLICIYCSRHVLTRN